MTDYLITACGTVFLSVLVSFMIPQGKLGKTITAIFRIICIVILITPLLNLFNLSETSYENYIDYDYICSVYSQNQSSALEEEINEEFGVKAQCAVTIEYSDGNFNAQNVEVCLLNGNGELNEKIYEYLQSKGYINITVYEETSG